MGALDGIRVAEAGLLVQGPQAAVLLSDWGAEVVKVELPGFGDQSRWIPLAPDDPRSAWFHASNRGKRSMTVDLRTPAGQEAFRRLAAQVDVVITNFTPGTMEGWGLGYDELAVRNPRLVYAAGSTFGPEGPDSTREGADLSAQAAGGLISTTGSDGTDLSPIAITIADHVASQNLVAGILAALFARERTGRGPARGHVAARRADLGPGQRVHGLPADRPASPVGRTAAIPSSPGCTASSPRPTAGSPSSGSPARRGPVLFETLGVPELTERFDQVYYWREQKDALFPLLDDAFRRRTTAEWCAALSQAGLRHAPVRDHAEVVADPGPWINGYFAKVQDDAGERAVVATPVRFSDTPAVPGAALPELGQHTEEVLLELGYTWDEIAELSGAGVI